MVHEFGIRGGTQRNDKTHGSFIFLNSKAHRSAKSLNNLCKRPRCWTTHLLKIKQTCEYTKKLNPRYSKYFVYIDKMMTDTKNIFERKNKLKDNTE